MKNILLLGSLFLFSATTVFSQDSERSIALTQEGINLFDAGKYNEALEKYEQAIKLDKNNGHALYEAGNTYMALKDYKTGLKYAERLIDKGIEPVSEAYILKGNALDMLEKPEKAIAAYKEGIEHGKPNSMLHFNLGIALLRAGKNKEAAPCFQQALTLDPTHRSSHYCLGLSYADLNLKVKTLLPLYYFLMIENQGQRAKASCTVIKGIVTPKLENNGNKNMNVNIDPGALGDEFGRTEMLISLQPVGEILKRQAIEDSLHVKLPEPTLSESVAQFNNMLFESLSSYNEENGKAKTTFWWATYGNFFAELHKKGHTEAFSYYLMLGEGDPKAKDWLVANKAKLEAFSDWVKEYQAKQ